MGTGPAEQGPIAITEISLTAPAPGVNLPSLVSNSVRVMLRSPLSLLPAIPAAALALLGTGCRADLPKCTPEVEERAHQVAFIGSQPSYEGQAINNGSCGNAAFCHSPVAEGDRRFGAPKGLDFMVIPTDPVPRVREGHESVLGNRQDIATQVARGWMPPGALDPANIPTYRRGPGSDADTLPSVKTSEGEQILREWLACGAPVVTKTRAPMGDEQGGESCGEGRNGFGDCVVSAPQAR